MIQSTRTSDYLEPGKVYTRADLQDLFKINDATINTGIFSPKGYESIWLFVTEHKTSDRTAYEDSLIGDTLYFQGQTSGRTDIKLIEHEARGQEVMVFYRRKKYEHPGAGFRYEGIFRHIRHSGSNPTNFVFQCVNDPLGETAQEADQAGAFSPSSVEDARKRALAAIVRRQGQPAFRRALMVAYDGKCAITGCDVKEALEAAHIYPYQGAHTNDVTNGLLLRADLHTLFDLGLIGIDPSTSTVVISSRLHGTAYEEFASRPATLPNALSQRPSKDALAWHLAQARLE